jgi:hypothetical protein
MSKRVSNPFLREHSTPDREGDAKALEEFLKNGGKVQKLHDSKTAEYILKRRRQVAASAEKRTSGAMPAGIPLVSDVEAITVKE